MLHIVSFLALENNVGELALCGEPACASEVVKNSKQARLRYTGCLNSFSCVKGAF